MAEMVVRVNGAKTARYGVTCYVTQAGLALARQDGGTTARTTYGSA